MNWLMIVLLCVCGDVRKQDVEFRVDMLELHHFVAAGDGRLAYVQVIAWQCLPEDGKFRALGFKLVPNDPESRDNSTLGRPTRTPDGGATFKYLQRVNGKPIIVTVRSKLYKESVSSDDPERIDSRNFWKPRWFNVFEDFGKPGVIDYELETEAPPVWDMLLNRE